MFDPIFHPIPSPISLCRVKRLCFLILGFLLLGVGTVQARPKTDVIGMANGDRLTVEIKELQNGKLTCKTNAMGTVSIEWEEVALLQSGYYFRVVNSEGRLLFGSISVRPAPAVVDSLNEQGSHAETTVLPFSERLLEVVVGTMMVPLPMSEVVEITAIAQSFWSRIDGSLAVGFNYTRASDVAQLNFDWRNIYRAERNRVSFDVITILTRNSGEDVPKRRLDYSLGYVRRLVNSWTADTNVAFQRNDELGLRARYILSLGGGFAPIWTNFSHLSTFLGAALNAEEGEDSGEFSPKWEAQAKVSYSLFRYNSPKADLNTSLEGFFGLTEKERYRANFDIRFRYELLGDFFFELNYYLSWDNKNPTTGTESTDYGVGSGISWTY